jgi:hypothetical protein
MRQKVDEAATQESYRNIVKTFCKRPDGDDAGNAGKSSSAQ